MWIHATCKLLFFNSFHKSLNLWYLEAVAQRCSVKKVFIEILQTLQENACAFVSFFNKVAALSLKLYLKRDSGTGVLL